MKRVLFLALLLSVVSCATGNPVPVIDDICTWEIHVDPAHGLTWAEKWVTDVTGKSRVVLPISYKQANECFIKANGGDLP